MKGSHDARIGRLESRLNPEASRNPMAKPIPEHDLAFLNEYEKVTENTTVAERPDPESGPELVRLAAELALRPLGFSVEDIAAYVAEVEVGLWEARGEG